MGVLTENPRTGEHIVSEAPGTRSREAIIIAESAALLATTVLGAIPGGTATSAAKAGGNTGNGTFVLDATTPILPRAKRGTLTARFTSTTNIRIEDADGYLIADLTIGGTTGNSVTLGEQVKGVFTQGATPFAVGDGFDVIVSKITTAYKKLDPAATDGTQIAAGILYAGVDASEAAAPGVAHVRDCEVNGNLLTWPAAITTAQKDKAIGDLERLGIILRS
ncbi:head decoration protein [Rhizorhabdus wittichii]|uniref:Head decoration protein n=1 Tax=Rhizorhabdus wittichii TaxID=160791 RepID=A0A975CXL4_9SPHN|nr:head decoration protein [Rhizorhabdus wittichii]QTH19655.1 head decoration protein [Rhizorhabdus wittichii]